MPIKQPHHTLHQEETALLRQLREARRRLRLDAAPCVALPLTKGQRVADYVAKTMGSWPFIIIQTTILLF